MNDFQRIADKKQITKAEFLCKPWVQALSEKERDHALMLFEKRKRLLAEAIKELRILGVVK